MIIRNDIPIGYTYDEHGNVLTYKDSDGYWYECTYDQNGKELTYKHSDGYWYEYTYDQNGKELTFKNSAGKDGVAIAYSDGITLFHNKQSDTFFGGRSKVLSREQVLERMDREDDMACLFTLAIGLNCD